MSHHPLPILHKGKPGRHADPGEFPEKPGKGSFSLSFWHGGGLCLFVYFGINIFKF